MCLHLLNEGTSGAIMCLRLLNEGTNGATMCLRLLNEGTSGAIMCLCPARGLKLYASSFPILYLQYGSSVHVQS